MSTKVSAQVFSLTNMWQSIMGFLSQREQALASRISSVFRTHYHCKTQEMVLMKGTFASISETEFLNLFSEPNRFPAITKLRFGKIEQEKDPTPAPPGSRRTRRYLPSILKAQDFAKVGLACPNLRTLFLYGFSVGLDSLLSTMPHLEDITFDYYVNRPDLDISNAALDRLTALKNLKRTKLLAPLNFVPFTEKIPALTALHLSGMNRDQLECIVGVTTLQELRIGGNDVLCNEDLGLLNRAKNLRTLGISNCMYIGNENFCNSPWCGLKDIGRDPAITHFILGKSDVLERAMYFLPAWPHLRELTIEKCSRTGGFSELESGVQALARCEKLERVNIIKFTGYFNDKLGGMMVALGRIPSLRVVKLEESNFTTDNVVTFLEAATGVQELMLVRCKEVDGDRISKVPTKVRITIE